MFQDLWEKMYFESEKIRRVRKIKRLHVIKNEIEMAQTKETYNRRTYMKEKLPMIYPFSRFMGSFFQN